MVVRQASKNDVLITHCSIRKFDFHITDGVLVDFVRRNYAADSAAVLAAECHRFTHVVDAINMLISNSLQEKVRLKESEIFQRIRQAEKEINYDKVKGNVSRLQYLVLKNFGLAALYHLLKWRRRAKN